MDRFSSAECNRTIARASAATVKVWHDLYPDGNVPVEVADFFANSSASFKATATAAAYYAQGQSGAQMVQAITPLRNSLAGITLVLNFSSGVFRFGQAIDSGNQEERGRVRAIQIARTQYLVTPTVSRSLAIRSVQADPGIAHLMIVDAGIVNLGRQSQNLRR